MVDGGTDLRPRGRGFFESGLWFIPLMSLIGASVLALLTTSLDRRLAGGQFFEELFSRNPEAMRSALSVVASSILTFTALVFSVTMLVVQQASNQLSPRVVQAFLEDRTSQYTLGTFLGTFAYTLLVLRDIRSPVEGVGFVPGMSVAVVFVTVLASLTMFVAYLNHVTESIKVDVVADRILTDTQQALDRVYPHGGDVERDPTRAPDHDSPQVIRWRDRPGVIQDLDVAPLREHASAVGAPVVVVPATGSYVRPGTVMLRVPGTPDRADALLAAFRVGPTRSRRTDVAFGFRQLVDIAIRALSPGINDPTTAVQVTDRIHDLLAELASRQIPLRVHGDDDELLVVLPGPGWDDYVDLGLTEIRHYGADSIQVLQHLRAVLDDLLDRAPAGRGAVLERHRGFVVAALESLLDEGTVAADESPTVSPGVTGPRERTS